MVQIMQGYKLMQGFVKSVHTQFTKTLCFLRRHYLRCHFLTFKNYVNVNTINKRSLRKSAKGK